MWEEKIDPVEKAARGADPWGQPGLTQPEREGSAEELPTGDSKDHSWSQRILITTETFKGIHV